MQKSSQKNISITGKNALDAEAVSRSVRPDALYLSRMRKDFVSESGRRTVHPLWKMSQALPGSSQKRRREAARNVWRAE